MTDLPPDVNALLDKARVAHDPNADDAERVRARLYAALAAGAALGGAAGVSSAQAGGWSSLWATASAKLVVAALVVGGSLGVWAAQRSEAPAAQPARPVAAPGAPLPPALPAPSAAPMRADPPTPQAAPPAGPVETAQPGLEAAATMRRTVRIAPTPPRRAPEGAVQSSSADRAASTSVPPAPSTPAVAASPSAPTEPPEAPAAARSHQAELSLMRSALEAINGGQPARGLALLEAHAQRYPAGLLLEERAGLRVVALCALGQRDAGLREQGAYLRRYGQSPLAARVGAACKAGQP